VTDAATDAGAGDGAEPPDPARAITGACAEKVIARSADEVWGRIGDFGDVSWIPGSGTCRVEGDERTITVPSGFGIVHQLLELDDDARSYRYRLASGFDLSAVYGPGHTVTHLEAELRVEPHETSSALVTYSVETHAFLVASSRDDFQRALDNLDALLTA
jgi:hypothetical protein